MGIHNSLVLVPDSEAEAAVETAFLLAEQSQGHVTGVHVTGDSVLNMPPIIEGMTERQIMREFEGMRERLTGLERDAQRLFDEVASRHSAVQASKAEPGQGMTASWLVLAGRAERVLSERTRVFDLLISGVAGTTAGESTLSALEHAVFDAGRPVLVVPRTVPKSIASTIMIGWNRAANAARAVMAAMPMLTSAKRVVIGYVDTGAKSGPSAEDLASSLSWHGITAEVRTISPGGAPVSDLLMSEATDIGADLVVMGAYSHSRMREFVLGGVTRQALRRVVTPIMLMH